MYREIIMLQIIENVGKYSAKCTCYHCKSEYFAKNKYDAKKSPIGYLCNTCKTSISNMGEITKDKLQKVFNYNTHTGELTYKFTTSIGRENELATIKHSAGYLTTRINSKDYLAHRIIYLYMTGNFPNQIDHINHNREDNRWSNLREVSNRENHLNESLSKNSSTKVLGVSLHKPTKKYRAYIMVNKKQIHLGLFNTIEQASLARKQANIQHNFHDNHGK